MGAGHFQFYSRSSILESSTSLSLNSAFQFYSRSSAPELAEEMQITRVAFNSIVDHQELGERYFSLPTKPFNSIVDHPYGNSVSEVVKITVFQFYSRSSGQG